MIQTTRATIVLNGKEYPAILHTVPPPEIDPQQVADFNAELRRLRESTITLHGTLNPNTAPTGPIVEGSIEPQK